MTVLRSREIVTSLSPLHQEQKSSLKTLKTTPAKREIVQLDTPIKNHGRDRLTDNTINHNNKSMGLKSVSAGAAPRRSSRLVSKSNGGEVKLKGKSSSPVFSSLRTVDRSSKRCKVMNTSGVNVEIESVEKFDDDDNGKVRVLEVKEQTPEKTLVSVLVSSKNRNSENVVEMESVEKVRVWEPESDQKSDNVEDVINDVEMVRFNEEKTRQTLKKVNGKRKLNSDNSLPSDLGADDVDSVVKQLMSLRSGKEVAKIFISESEDNDYKLSFREEEMGFDAIDADTMSSNGEGEDKIHRWRLWVKGKTKVGSDGLLDKGKAKVVNDELLVNGVEEMEFDVSKIGESVTNANDTESCRRKFSRVEKGKGKMNEGELLSIDNDISQFGLESKSDEAELVNNTLPQSVHLLEEVAMEVENEVINRELRIAEDRRKRNQGQFKKTAKKKAYKFAHFVAEEEEAEINPSDEVEEAMPSQEVNEEVEDWPGPFSTAMKILKDRALKLEVQQQTTFSSIIKPIDVSWIPKSKEGCEGSKRVPPTLKEMCLKVLLKHADAIHSLDNVPDLLRHKLSKLLCDSRRMNSQMFKILMCGSPTEVRVKDCSSFTEDEFTKCFEGCEKSHLTVLQLDQCGRCLPDYVVHTTLGLSLNSLPSLTTLSLKGGCRLSDIGLSSLVLSAPALRSINLSQCSLLTAAAIDTLANALGSILRELYIDDCQGINVMVALPALKKLQHLEVLSLSGVESVSNAFMRKFMSICGRNMRELVLTDCVKLTDSSLKAIALSCPGLCVLDLANLTKLTDSSLGFLANGGLQIQKLRLRRNPFSDEAIAAYLEASGKSLQELSLNNVKKVGYNTALAIAKHSKDLQDLDLSFCRDVTDNAMGLIVDSCSSLKLLKIFGCTQVTIKFFDGHSNPHVKIIGRQLTPILEHLTVPHSDEAPLHYSYVC